MLILKDYIELKELLIRNEITLEDAIKIIKNNFKPGNKSWHTSDWKERKEKIIKEKCEICGGKEKLTLQHLSHPKKYYEYEKEIENEVSITTIESHFRIDKNELIEYITLRYEFIPIPLCPKCSHRNPNKRMRKIPQYLCTKCGNEFDEPKYKSAFEIIEIYYENKDSIEALEKCFVSKDKWENRHNLSKIENRIIREKGKVLNPVKKKEAFLLYLNENIKYLSFEDTITACNKCAFNYDLNNKDLCPKCKNQYKDIKHQTCFECLPEEKKKHFKEKKEEYEKLNAMHIKFNID